MFDFGFQELILILIVALLVVGPKELPEIARALARGLRQFQRALQDIGSEDEPVHPRDTWTPEDDLPPAKSEAILSQPPHPMPTDRGGEDETASGKTETRMTLIEHLTELRTRLIYCLAGAAAGMILAWYLCDPWLLNLLKAPLDRLSGNSDNPFAAGASLLHLPMPGTGAAAPRLDLHFMGPMEVFVVKLKVAFFAGLILASPFIFYHIWAFVAEGLTGTERKIVHLLIPASLILFLLGLLAAYFVVLPMTLYFLVVVMGKGIIPTLMLTKYVGMVVACSLLFGVAFQLPIVILVLTRLRLVSPEFLARKRKYAILFVFILAAILTPPDVLSQLLMALPMVLLYELSILAAKVPWFRPRKTRGG